MGARAASDAAAAKAALVQAKQLRRAVQAEREAIETKEAEHMAVPKPASIGHAETLLVDDHEDQQALEATTCIDSDCARRSILLELRQEWDRHTFWPGEDIDDCWCKDLWSLWPM